ncbi:hypothetical protein ACLMJK_001577 [Lecanora helva]
MTLKDLQRLGPYAKRMPFGLPPRQATHISGGSNLEIFKFGMYIMFPIGWMYYFGTNLENRFAVPDFWPEPGSTHKLPFEREELKEMSEQLKAQRLERRRKRLEQARVEAREVEQEETPRIEKRENAKDETQALNPKPAALTDSVGRWFKGG